MNNKTLEEEIMETKKIYNLVILDASGSMGSIYSQALAGVNETISTIKKAQKDMPEQQQYLTLVSFADGDAPLLVNNKLTPIDLVNTKTDKDYPIRGSTALYDAIGDCVTELRETVTASDKALVTIITDGYENDSQRWDGHKVKSLIEELKSAGWVFTFIGANQDVVEEAGKVGITNSLKFEATIEGTVEMFRKEGCSRRRWNEKVYRGEENIEEGYFDEEPYEEIEGDSNRVSPERIDSLKQNEIFVFGSNIAGHHDGGAAFAAMRKFGAVYGQGRGLQGHSYAIPTTGDPRIMCDAIDEFIRFARIHPEMRFLVTAIGCGHGGWTPQQVAPLFKDAASVQNIALPKSFWDVIRK